MHTLHRDRKGGAKERMRIERNAQVTGVSQSYDPANPDSPPALGTRNGTGLDNDQTQPSTEQLLAERFLRDPAGAMALTVQLGPSPEDRSQRIAALQSAIADGTYQASPEQTAEAILSEQQVRDGTAA